MPPFPYQRVSELRNQKNPRLPEMFFQMSREEIVAALVAMGYGERAARQEAEQFERYRGSLTSAQTFSDNDDTETTPEPVEEYKGFAQVMADMKRKEE